MPLSKAKFNRAVATSPVHHRVTRARAAAGIASNDHDPSQPCEVRGHVASSQKSTGRLPRTSSINIDLAISEDEEEAEDEDENDRLKLGIDASEVKEGVCETRTESTSSTSEENCCADESTSNTSQGDAPSSPARIVPFSDAVEMQTSVTARSPTRITPYIRKLAVKRRASSISGELPSSGGSGVKRSKTMQANSSPIKYKDALESNYVSASESEGELPSLQLAMATAKRKSRPALNTQQPLHPLCDQVSCSNQVRELQVRLLETEARKKTLERRFQEVDRTNEGLAREIEELQMAIADHDDEVIEYKNLIEAQNVEYDRVLDAYDLAEARAHAFSEELSIAEDALHAKERDIERINKMWRSMVDSENDLINKLHTLEQSHKQAMVKLNQRRLSEIAELRKQDTHDKECQEFRDRIQDLEEEVQDLKSELNGNLSDHDEKDNSMLDVEVRATRRELQRHERSHHETAGKMQKATAEVEMLRRALEEKDRKIGIVEAKALATDRTYQEILAARAEETEEMQNMFHAFFENVSDMISAMSATSAELYERFRMIRSSSTRAIRDSGVGLPT